MIMNRNLFTLGAVLGAALVVAACSDSTAAPGDPTPVQTTGNNTGSRQDSVPGNGNSNSGAVAGIRIVPQSMRIIVGSSVGATVIPVDANGVPALGALSGQPTWRVANTAIARVTASGGVVTGVAAGTTKLYATLGTYTDSANVLVATTADTIPTPTPVTSFSLLTYSFTRLAPTTPGDTARSVVLPGAEVSLYRVTVPSSTSNPGGTRVLVRTLTSDASGQAMFANLPPDSYSVSAKATYNGAALEARQDFTTPYTPNYVLTLNLTKP